MKKTPVRSLIILGAVNIFSALGYLFHSADVLQKIYFLFDVLPRMDKDFKAVLLNPYAFELVYDVSGHTRTILVSNKPTAFVLSICIFNLLYVVGYILARRRLEKIEREERESGDEGYMI